MINITCELFAIFSQNVIWSNCAKSEYSIIINQFCLYRVLSWSYGMRLSSKTKEAAILLKNKIEFE